MFFYLVECVKFGVIVVLFNGKCFVNEVDFYYDFIVVLLVVIFVGDML